tara:strand:- start:31 stop:279 length:249 start_codon:yes stop_codon:yes gene_type:complete
MTTIKKAIAYAYATSKNAKLLGFEDTGCFYIEHTMIDIEGSGQWNSGPVFNAEGFLKKDDPVLLAMFTEAEGEISRNVDFED